MLKKRKLESKDLGLLSDKEIRHLCDPSRQSHVMISDFVDYHRYKEDTKGMGPMISYGLTSYGYDVRVGNKYKVFTNTHGAIVDPKNFDKKAFVDITGDHCIIPPNSFALAATFEEFNIPTNVLAICLGKSTYARCGIIVNVTPLEPEWKGTVTIEISNTTTLPVKIYSFEGIAQVLFFASRQCARTYADKKGKYQNQKGVTLPKPNTVQK